MLAFALLLALVWGVCVAVAIEFVPLGRWIAERMTWLSVAAGVGGDLLILLLLIDEAGRVAWWHMAAVIALSSLGVVFRGLRDAYLYHNEMMAETREAGCGQTDSAGE
jgi:hypothetical protein